MTTPSQESTQESTGNEQARSEDENIMCPVTEKSSGYGAMLIVTAVFLPGVAALITVLLFLAPCIKSCENLCIPIVKIVFDGKCTPFIGTGISLVLWLILPNFYKRFSDARYSIPNSYGELCQRLVQLKAQLDVFPKASDSKGTQNQNIASKQACNQVEMIKIEFSQRGMVWALAQGYINAWSRLHRAEEAMIEVLPKETVIAGALNDVLRVQGSKIDHEEDLIARLRQAIDVIDPSARKYLQGASAAALPLVITTPSPLVDGYVNEPYSLKLAFSGGTPPIQWALSQGGKLPDVLQLNPDGLLNGKPTLVTNVAASFSVRATDSANVTATKTFSISINQGPAPVPAAGVTAATNASGANSICTMDQQAQARAILREVHCAINEYRDGCWNGIIVARNRLLITMMFTGLTAYTLLSIAILMGAQSCAIEAASAFFLVGAIIGLLNQMRSASQHDTAVEDYGLSIARLICAPLFSGLAAIGGVVLMAMPQVAGSYTVNTTPLAITTTDLPAGVYEQSYNQKLDATGGVPTYKWKSKDSLTPAGLKLNESGELNGKLPKKSDLTAKPLKFTALVIDSSGTTTEKPLLLNVTSMVKTPAEKLTPSQVTTATTTNQKYNLKDIFDLQKNFFGLLLAAAFGLSPGLLLDKLQQQSEKYKTDLKGSEATQTNSQPPK